MTIAIQKINFKNDFKEIVGSFQKVVALSNFRVVLDDELVDISGLANGESIHNFDSTKGYVFKKISATRSDLQIRNIVVAETTKEIPTSAAIFPNYIVLASGQTRTVPTDMTSNPDNVTESIRKTRVANAYFAELREMGEKAQRENLAEMWALESLNDFSILSAGELPTTGQGSKLRKKVVNMRDRYQLILGMAARIVKSYIDPTIKGSRYTVPSDFATVTDGKLEGMMRAVRAEFEIDPRLWFNGHNEGTFLAASLSNKIYFSRKTGSKKTTKYQLSNSTFFVAVNSTDFDAIYADFLELLQGFDEG